MLLTAVYESGSPPTAPAAGEGEGELAMNPAPDLDVLRTRISAVLQEYGIAGAGIALVATNGVIWSGGLGVADRSTGRLATADTPFRVWSISKSVTALAVMQQVEAGRLSLDDRVRDVAPEVPFDNPWEATAPVRVANLLEHTAGFEFARFNEVEGDPNGPRPLLEALLVNPRSRVSRWPPGNRMSYSNEGYAIAGYLLEKITGRSFDDLVNDQIFAPLGMSTAAFLRTPETARKLAIEYLITGPELPYSEDMLRPAANMIASPADMASYARLWLSRGQLDGRQVLSPAGIDRMETNRTLSYGGPQLAYGLGTDTEEFGGFVAHGHIGASDAGATSFRYFPREGVGWALMLNTGDSRGARNAIERELAAFQLKGKTPPAPTSAIASAADLQAVAGVYRDATPPTSFIAPLTALFSRREYTVRDGALWERRCDLGGLRTLLLPSASLDRLTPVGPGAFRYERHTVSSVFFTKSKDGRPAIVTDHGYYEKSEWWVTPLSRWLLFAAMIGLLSPFVVAPVWIIPAIVSGHVPGGLWVRTLPPVAALAGLLAFALFNRAPQPLNDVNATTVGIFVFSSLFAILSGVALIVAVALPARDIGPLLRAHSVAVAAVCVGLTFFAAQAHWIGLRTWSW